MLGGLFGYFSPKQVIYIKPIGEMFLNLILTTVVPLIFFCVSASMTKFSATVSLPTMLWKMIGLFIGLGTLASLFMLILVLFFPLSTSMVLPTTNSLPSTELHLLDNLPALLTVSQFGDLFSTTHMLALIIFSMFIGMAAKAADKSGTFVACLQSGEAVFIHLFSLIMKLAPLGFFAYFATIVHDLGTQLIANYVHVIVLYYLASIVYFFGVFSLYAYLAGGVPQVRLFWSNVLMPSITAIATCSSAATIPVNAEAVKKMHVLSSLAETIIPLGTILHKQGSIMGGVVKIAFLYGLFHLNFLTLPALCGAIGVSLLVGTVMGAIPSGGMLGDLLILNIYGFPPNSLYLIATISLLIDPPATLLNVTGNTIAGVLFNRLNKSHPHDQL